jgi:tetratricopeptide (TPR) repeat protein
MTIWQWFQDWRNKRNALAEFDALQHADEALLRDNELNPLNQAKKALDRGDLVAAAELWQVARQKMPLVIYESDDSLPILLGLKRYEEAEAFVTEGQRRLPRDFRWRRDSARIAEARGDHIEAARRWREAQSGGAPADEILGAMGREGMCLRAAGQLDEAEAALERTIRLDPANVLAQVEHAKLSGDRKDWEQCAARWRALVEKIQMPVMFGGYADALMHLNRLDEADAMLDKAVLVYPGDQGIALARCYVAEQRGDFEEASSRWATAQRNSPYLEPIYSHRARCLERLGRCDEADAVLSEAIGRFRDNEWALREYAEFAQRRQDWNEACLRWAALRAKFPENEAAYVEGRVALRAAGRQEEAEALRRES